MPGNKTRLTEEGVAAYLARIESPDRRRDCEALTDLMSQASGEQPKMWGAAIVGFGVRRYRYDSGREGETCRVGFSSRKGDISLYGLSTATGAEGLRAKLGKHKEGKGCLYVTKLSDIEPKVLAQLVASAARAERS